MVQKIVQKIVQNMVQKIVQKLVQNMVQRSKGPMVQSYFTLCQPSCASHSRPSRARFYPFPSPSDACHAGYAKAGYAWRELLIPLKGHESSKQKKLSKLGFPVCNILSLGKAKKFMLELRIEKRCSSKMPRRKLNRSRKGALKCA